jgi:pimeloyl-ACP methyl ester carboxylesterase
LQDKLMPMELPPPPASQPVQVMSQSSWQASERVILETERMRPGFCFREAALPAYVLPSVLKAPDGTTATSVAEWEKTVRPALVEQFSHFVYGRPPAVPRGIGFETVEANADALDGKATYRRIRISIPTPQDGKPFTFEYSLFVPNRVAGKPAVFLLLNNRPVRAADPSRERKSEFWPVETIIEKGYATAVLQLTAVQPDKADGLTNGLVAALPSDAKPEESWATIAAWAWAASRVLDSLETVPDVDGRRVAVIGHSRGGKTALWAGATDPRFGMVISNCSGCGGAALSRRPFGETLTEINRVFPHWFCGNFKTFNEHPDRLSVDQHQLLATIAPRPLYIGCADEDLWADPRGEFLALAATSPVAQLYGQRELRPEELPAIDEPIIRGHLAYHVRRGGHDLTLWDWQHYLAFADGVWK